MRLAALIGSIFLAGCSVVGIRSGTEEPSYEVVAGTDAYEIRRYGERVAADTVVEAGEEAARNQGFRRLADYIFGNNMADTKIDMTAPVAQQPAGAGGESEKIAMTAPVAQQRTETGAWQVRFFLPADYTLENAPTPNNDQVRLHRVPPQTMAVRRFSGSRSPEAVAEETQALLAALENSPWQPTGKPVAWFYDPPWTVPALRRNEVAVPVEGG